MLGHTPGRSPARNVGCLGHETECDRGTAVVHLHGVDSSDFVRSISLDGNSNIYVAGRSFATWGSPINAYSGGPSDAAVWKLDSSGARLWHTYMGSAGGEDYGFGIAVDGNENAYVSGLSPLTWGTPINPFVAGAGESQGFAAKLKSNGAREWHTFVGKDVGGWGMAIDGGRNIFVGGLPEIGAIESRRDSPAAFHNTPRWQWCVSAHRRRYERERVFRRGDG